MAGISDNAFRQICKDAGAEYTATEMISAKAVNFKNAKTLNLAKTEDHELPAAIQLFGSDGESMAGAAKYLCDNYKCAAIDINMGCPVPKIIGGGDGSALMRNPVLAGEIMRSVVKAAAEYGVPVTVKIRGGWSEREKNAPEIAKIAEDSGIEAIFIHGRTRERMYMPPVDLEIIRKTKDAAKIPVVGNGDIFKGQDAQNMKALTNCDGVMIARGALGNPWIFGEVLALFENREYAPPKKAEKMATIKTHLEKMVFYKGERTATLEARKHLAWYIKGGKGSAAARDKINHSENLKEMTDIVWEVI
ncbi:MAG: tRNA dihydrouridine synthase DusB [Oscillospiraceae bacterium]|nr:tRNA dihydrouridine synthase DusB [Oscillospiraceae bacterium]